MGLDMYAYAGRTGQRSAYREQDGDWNPETREWVVTGPVAIAN